MALNIAVPRVFEQGLWLISNVMTEQHVKQSLKAMHRVHVNNS